MTISIPWSGGEQPVPDFTHVYLKFRHAGYDIDEPFYSQEVDWIHDTEAAEFDIISYSVADVQPIFVEWAGGENPAPGKDVEIVVRGNPLVVSEADSDLWDWSHDPNDSDADIVLYRVIE